MTKTPPVTSPEENSDWVLEHIGDHPFIKIPPIHIGGYTLDLSITTTVFMLMIVSALLIIFLTYAAWSNRKRKYPRGVGNVVEIAILFVRDDIVKPTMGANSEKYVPYFITLFLFVLFANMLGLIPFMHTATGNVSVTAAMALTTFAMTQALGIKNNGLFGYIKGLMPPGLPLMVVPIMIIIEFLSLLTKPFALCIRLFANMSAGHIVLFTLIGLIFSMGYAIVPVSVGFALFINLLEILICLLQAYIFTILSALFIGMAVHQEH